MTFLLAFLFTLTGAYAGGPVIWSAPYPMVLGKGGIRIQNSDTTTTCTTARAGSIRYNAGVFQWCNGSAWSTFGSGSGSGTVTSVVAGSGLTPLTITNSGTLTVDSGTGANKIVKLTSTAQYPAVDGFLISNIAASWSNLTGANSALAVDNAGYPQTWSWNSLTNQNAVTISTNNTSLTSGALLALTQTPNGAGVANSMLKITSSGAGSTVTGVDIQNSAGSGGTASYGIKSVLTGNNIGAAGYFTNSSTTGQANALVVQTLGSTGARKTIDVLSVSNEDASYGIYTTMSGATANLGAVVGIISNSTNAASSGVYGQISSASGTGQAVWGYNLGSGGYAFRGSVTGAGAKNALLLENVATEANNNGTQVVFTSNRTTSGATQVAMLTGLITDITQAAYKGALVFKTANNAAPSERFRIDYAGHQITTGAAPAVSSCGSGPSIAGNDVAGRVTLGTGGVTSCTLTFAVAYATAPVCTIGDETTSVLTTAVATTTTLTMSGLYTDSDKVVYHCTGY